MNPPLASQATPPAAISATPDPEQSPRPSKIALAFWLFMMLVLWSGNYVAGKIALRTLDPITLTCLRLQLAAFIMLAIYFTRRERQPLKLSDAWPFLYLGFREAEQAADLAVWDRVTLDQLSSVAFGDVEPLA